MKLIVTGSLGHISKPLTQELIQKGHSVTVISSNPEKRKEIEALGALPAIGSVEDAGFLTTAFTGADAAYVMVPPNHYNDPNMDINEFVIRVTKNYAQAIQQTGLKRVVHLSSIGADLDRDSGLIIAHHNGEKILRAIPGLALTHMRPVAFYYNLYAFLPVIRNQGVIASNYGADDRCPWVAPVDIAAAVAEELTRPFTASAETSAPSSAGSAGPSAASAGTTIRYVASDEPTCNEIARALGEAIGKPDLRWIVISDEEMKSALRAAGLGPSFAAGLVELNASIHSGKLSADYYRNRPAVMGKVKIADFAKEFAAVYQKN